MFNQIASVFDQISFMFNQIALFSIKLLSFSIKLFLFNQIAFIFDGIAKVSREAGRQFLQIHQQWKQSRKCDGFDSYLTCFLSSVMHPPLMETSKTPPIKATSEAPKPKGRRK